VLVYADFSSGPRRVVVRTPAGHIVLDDRFPSPAGSICDDGSSYVPLPGSRQASPAR